MVSDIGISLTSKHFGTLPKKSSELHMHHSLLQGRTSSDMKGFLIKVLVWNIISFTWKGFKQNDLGRVFHAMGASFTMAQSHQDFKEVYCF
jgi:hypothetical protein